MSRALVRSASASSSRSCLRRACPRRKSALRLAPRSSTTSHSVAAPSQSSSLSWQLARFRWQASLSSCTAFLSAPVSTPFFSTRSTSVQPCLYCAEAALWSDPLNLVLPWVLAPSASSTSSSSSSGTSMADAFNLASTDTGAAGAAAGSAAEAWLRRDLRSSPLMFSIWFIACCAIAGLDIIACACCIIAGSMFLDICAAHTHDVSFTLRQLNKAHTTTTRTHTHTCIMRSMSSGDIFAIIFCAASIICGFIILPVRQPVAEAPVLRRSAVQVLEIPSGQNCGHEKISPLTSPSRTRTTPTGTG